MLSFYKLCSYLVHHFCFVGNCPAHKYAGYFLLSCFQFLTVLILYVLHCRNAFKHELTLLEKVRHPNVVQFVGAVTQNVPMMIVLEYHSRVLISLYFSIHTCTSLCVHLTLCLSRVHVGMSVCIWVHIIVFMTCILEHCVNLWHPFMIMWNSISILFIYLH